MSSDADLIEQTPESAAKQTPESQITTVVRLEALEIEIEWGRYTLGVEFVNRGAPIEINGTLSAVKTVGSLVFGFLNASRKAFKKRLSGN